MMTESKHITENGGLLDNFLPGNVVLADRGFLVGDVINLYKAKLKIPALQRARNN